MRQPGTSSWRWLRPCLLKALHGTVRKCSRSRHSLFVQIAVIVPGFFHCLCMCLSTCLATRHVSVQHTGSRSAYMSVHTHAHGSGLFHTNSVDAQPKCIRQLQQLLAIAKEVVTCQFVLGILSRSCLVLRVAQCTIAWFLLSGVCGLAQVGLELTFVLCQSLDFCSFIVLQLILFRSSLAQAKIANKNVAACGSTGSPSASATTSRRS